MRQLLLAAALLLPSTMARAADTAEPLAITPALIAAAQKEGSLDLQYTSPLVTMQGIAAAFSKAYPGIQVNIERKAGSIGAATLLQELAAGVNRLDVFEGSDIALNKQLVDSGAFAAVIPPDADKFVAQSRLMAPYLYFPNILRMVIAYNSSLITDEQAKLLRRWDGILDPSFKGKIATSEPNVGVTTMPWVYVLSDKGPGMDFLRKFKAQNPTIFTSTAQTRESIVSGQRAVSWGTDWDAATLIDIANGAPIRFVYPDPTPEYIVSGWGVLKKAPHPAAARLFFAWQFTRDAALNAQAPFSNTRSGRTDVLDIRPTLEAVRKQGWYAEPTSFWTPDYADWMENGTKYQQTWQQVMRGRR